jgi:hypothetical protein
MFRSQVILRRMFSQVMYSRPIYSLKLVRPRCFQRSVAEQESYFSSVPQAADLPNRLAPKSYSLWV